MFPMTAEEAPELQREVQRLLGRCMLRLQQCEAVIKAVVVHYEFSGPASNLAAILEAKSDSMKKVSLGAAVGKLVGTYLVPEGQELPSDDGGPDDVMWFGFRAQFAMDAAEFAQTELRLREFVDLRNTLVHHFIEQFDLWSVTGCVAARDHLIECYDRIDGHHETLRTWAVALEDARKASASFLKTAEFKDIVFNGIAPDGTVDWPHSGIVAVLRKAIAAHGRLGWTRLDDAIVYVRANAGEQTPEKYGCRSWPQVLHESGVFQLQYRTGDEGRREGWFRERARSGKR